MTEQELQSLTEGERKLIYEAKRTRDLINGRLPGSGPSTTSSGSTSSDVGKLIEQLLLLGASSPGSSKSGTSSPG